MIEIQFIFKNKKHIIKCENSDKIRDICENFAKEVSLDLDNLIFFDNGIKLNLEMDLYVEQQFNLEKNTKKKKLKKVELLVFEETPFYIKFFSTGPPTIIKVKETEKMKDVFERYAKIVNINDLASGYFLYNGNPILYDENSEETVSSIANSNDKKDKVMSITIQFDRETIKSNVDPEKGNILIKNGKSTNNYIDSEFSNYYQLFINEKMEDPEFYNKKWFYIKTFIILFIQYILIGVFSFLCNFFKDFVISMEPNIDKNFIIFQIILFFYLIVFYLVSFYYNKIKKGWYIITLHIFYYLISSYYGFLLLDYIKYKYIIIGFSLIMIEILSIIFNAIFVQKFNILSFFLISSSFSLLALILFSILWIKYLFPILYISGFWIVSFIYFILWIFISSKFCKPDEYLYSVLIFNYGIISGLSFILAFVIKKFIDSLKKNVKFALEETKFKEFLLLLVEYIFIIILVYIVFNNDYNSLLKQNSTAFNWFISVTVIILFIICLIIIIAEIGKEKNNCWYIFYVLYIPLMIIFYSLFSCLLKEKYILCFLFIIFFDLVFILFTILISGVDSFGMIFVYCIISNIISIIPLDIFWIKNGKVILYISLLSLAADIYIMIFTYVTKKNYENDHIASVIIYNYTFFSIIFSLSLFPVVGVLYLFFKCCTAMCQ